MRLSASFVVAATIALVCPAWAAEPEKLWEVGGLQEPESVLPDGDVLYVSNVVGGFRDKDGVGFISKVSPDGRMLAREWVSGLNAPKGLGKVGGTLYVADIDELVAIDVAAGKVAQRYPAEGAVFLNDVAAASDGRVFVSDTGTNTIWKLEGGVFAPWVEGEALKGPNGMLVEDDRLLVAGIGKTPKDGDAGTPANLIAVPFATKTPSDLGEGSPVGFLDGLVRTAEGVYLATDYVRGPLYEIKSDGSFRILIDGFGPGTADLAYDAASKTAFIPLSRDRKLVAYRIH
ncbi:hypothetical protein [Methylopila turkensis]|uniref:ATP/GTP-binding protein n=1 Tax=Methylopila turkensis TaxID=1437816 RepID=A0A9W6JSL9_9HYPH|nr:hypothetical protein [Methylopila turkensis]GLK80843.1 ATP/GTP-binding protein [Methylopila turkensis]